LADAELEGQLAAFAKSAWWEGAPRDAAIEAGMRRILSSETGEGLRRASRAGAVEREVPFSLRYPVTGLLPILAPVREAIAADPRWSEPPWKTSLDEAWVIVQGRIDCVFREDGGRWCLLDWKTDAVGEDALAARAATYEWQMRIYRRAVERLWGEVGGAWLAFLRPGRVVAVDIPE
jgi:ATP-dependent exoDNAse (exonuclease V) beta subunit